MWERIVEAGTGVHILWGIGMLGVLLKLIISIYLSGMVKASQDMSTTRRKSLKVIRQKLENRRSLAMEMGSGEAFVNKNVYNLKCLGVPLKAWSNLGRKLSLIVCMAISGAFLYYDVSWRGSPGMINFLANAFFVCAFLLFIENIFLVTNKLEQLKANIWDYLLSTGGSRVDSSGRHSKISEKIVTNQDKQETCSGSDEGKDVNEDTLLEPGLQESAADNEEILNSFLKEFFT